MTAEPRISVVVPTYDRKDRLRRVLDALAAQDIDEPFEVVVVSDGSTDGTDEYLRSDDVPEQVVAISQENEGPAVARNVGVQRARGELVVFVDDDVVAEPGLLRAHRDAHARHGNRAVVIGPMLTPDDHEMSPWIAWEQEMLAKQYRAMERGDYDATARQFYTGNVSLRTEHLAAVGGFDPAFRRAEDVELAFRLDDLGLGFHFEPTAIGRHYAERPYASWRRTAYDYGRNDIVFARDLRRTWLFQFIRDSFGWRHALIRRLIRRSIRSDTFRRRVLVTVERSIPVVGRVPGIARYPLSVVYGIEYHRGIADELGSVEAFDALIDSNHARRTDGS